MALLYFSTRESFPIFHYCFRNRDLSFIIFLIVLLTRVLISANSFTPKGVPLSRAALYDPQKDFSCLDGSKLIPFSFVNDDYCDCADGSDEPGTSACSRGSFFCLNAGHMSSYLQSSRVNDGICDCCDGSDEYQSQASCQNTCDLLGREAREEAERQTKLIREGFQKRLELSQRGKEIRKEKEDERSQLEVEKQNAESFKEQKLKLKEAAELPEKVALDKFQQEETERRKTEEEAERQKTEVEAEEMFALIDSNGDKKITMDEIKVRQTFDRNKDGEVSDEEAMFFLNMETEMTEEEFLKNGWLIAKPYFLIEQGMFQPPEQEPPQEGEEENENQENNAEAGDQDEYEDDEADELRNSEPEKESSQEEQNIDTESENVDESEKSTDNQVQNEKYDEETRKLITEAEQARLEFNEADKVVREITQKLQEVNDVLNLDFGEDERFAPLWTQCFDFDDREYTYTLCPFKEATQRGKSGGGNVQLGKWGNWNGPENNKYLQMLYDKGQGCWNGPARSAKVNLHCGTDNQLTSVSEPSRCEYSFDFITPSACEKIDVPQQHDEL